MPFEIVRNDITHMKADAIVNTANPRPVIGAGTDSAIHKAAGPQLLAERKVIGPIAPGSAAVTEAYNLQAKFVIHAVSPAWEGGDHGEADLLRRTYDSALTLAQEKQCRSIAFPLMASGSYGFPRPLALKIAVQACSDFLLEHDMKIWLVVFHKEAFQLSQQLMSDVRSYIDQHYVDEQNQVEYRCMASSRCRSPRGLRRRNDLCGAPTLAPKASLEDFLEKSGQETFTQAMLRRIQEQDWTEPEVYKRVHMDHKTFNKIRNNPQHQPSRRTALQLVVALHLTLPEAEDLLGKAGYALSPSNKFDLVLSYFLESGNYDIGEIDAALFEFTDKTLSKCS